MSVSFESFLIPELWKIVTDYLYEQDRIKLHAFGIKSNIHDSIPYDFPELKKIKFNFMDLKVGINRIDLDLIDSRDGVDFVFTVDHPFVYDFRFRTTAKYIKISFPDAAIGGITVESNTLEHLIVDVGSMSYLTLYGADSLQILRLFGAYSGDLEFGLHGAGNVKQLFLESNQKTSGTIWISGEMQATEYYGDVLIDPEQFPELQVYLITDYVCVDRYDELLADPFKKFRKLKVFACDGDISLA